MDNNIFTSSDNSIDHHIDGGLNQRLTAVENRLFTGAPDDIYERQRLANVHPARWVNPKPATTYGLVIIGAGTAGLVAAHGAAALGAKVALVEKELLGGDCLNIGCVPSKALIRTSRLFADMRNAQRYGATVPDEIVVDFPRLMQRMRAIRARISRSDSIQRLTAAGVDVFFGRAHFLDERSIDVNGTKLSFKKALVATGSRPDTPTIPGLSEAGFLTNESVFNITELPRRLMVIGGGPLGCELAQAFRRFGSEVTIAQLWPMFLPGEERDAAQLLSDAFARDGISVRLNTRAVSVELIGTEKIVHLVSEDHASTVVVDEILAGTGRLPNVDDIGLDAAGIQYDASGITVDDLLRTTNKRVYAAGDVCLEHKFTHTADASARIVVQNALSLGRKKLSALVIPWCTYTDPEIAHVGMHVREARDRNIPVKTYTIPMHEVDRAIVDSEDDGFVKIHIEDGTDRILGATIVARDAGEMINEVSFAIVSGAGLRSIATVIHAYPTKAEGIRKAALAHRLSYFTPKVQALVKRWVRWMS
ncbi:MAG: mercuric reductase [Gemmatimonadaceae bacterium]